MRDVISLSEPIIDSLTYDKSDTETDIPSPGTRRVSSAFLSTTYSIAFQEPTRIPNWYGLAFHYSWGL